MLRLQMIPELSIGEASRKTGLTTRAIRFYEDCGLLSARRNGRGARWYGGEALGRLAFISLARQAGLSIPQIGELVSLADGSEKDLMGRLQELLVSRLDAIEAERLSVEHSAQALGVNLPSRRPQSDCSATGSRKSGGRDAEAVRPRHQSGAA